ncbi:ABC transporter ATP-binding protein [Chitinibacteraceae bacterium HSL-7]
MVIAARELTRIYRTAIAPTTWQERLMQLVRGRYEDKLSVDRVSFAVTRGECVALVGPNGAGKSTTIKMLTGILAPTSGGVEVAGFNPQRERRQYVKRIGVVFGQRSQLWWDLPVRDSFLILKALFAVPDSIFERQLALFRTDGGMDEFWLRPARTLSLGQRMLCEIAASFLHAPDVVFLDEPTIGLDLEMKSRMRGLIRKLNTEEGTTVLITSHDVGDIERLCQRMLLIDEGRLRFDGSLADFKTHAGDGRWWAARLEGCTSAAAAAVSAHAAHVPVRVSADWLEVGQALPFAELLNVLAPYGVMDLKPVEQGLEELLHGFYLTGKVRA